MANTETKRLSADTIEELMELAGDPGGASYLDEKQLKLLIEHAEQSANTLTKPSLKHGQIDKNTRSALARFDTSLAKLASHITDLPDSTREVFLDYAHWAKTYLSAEPGIDPIEISEESRLNPAHLSLMSLRQLQIATDMALTFDKNPKGAKPNFGVMNYIDDLANFYVRSFGHIPPTTRDTPFRDVVASVLALYAVEVSTEHYVKLAVRKLRNIGA